MSFSYTLLRKFQKFHIFIKRKSGKVRNKPYRLGYTVFCHTTLFTLYSPFRKSHRQLRKHISDKYHDQGLPSSHAPQAPCQTHAPEYDRYCPKPQLLYLQLPAQPDQSLFIERAAEAYGKKGKIEAQHLAFELTELFASGELTPQDMDGIMYEMHKAYFKYREQKREKERIMNL